MGKKTVAKMTYLLHPESQERLSPTKTYLKTMERFVTTTALEGEAGRSQVQGQPGLQRELVGSLSNLVNPCLKLKSAMRAADVARRMLAQHLQGPGCNFNKQTIFADRDARAYTCTQKLSMGQEKYPSRNSN